MLFGCGGGGGGSDTGTQGAEAVVGNRANAGGTTTTTDRTTRAFENPASNLSAENLDRHMTGDVDFGAVFVSAPAPVNPGLGPLFNNSSCESCHTVNGRGQPVFREGGLRSHAVVRASLASGGVAELPGGPIPVPGLGTQLQDNAIFGVTPEISVDIHYSYTSESYPDGSSIELRKPTVSLQRPDGTFLGDEVLRSLRVPQPVFGVGLLESIPEERLIALSDPEDSDNDGISGRPNYVFDVSTGTTQLGRFGRKANQPTLLQQTASAYANDMGVGNPMFPDHAGTVDIPMETVESAAFYVATLAVPRALNTQNESIQSGERLFIETGCTSCHVPGHVTGSSNIPELSNQTIFPYTDMLLHDMGDGLADGRPDFGADGNEWRTAPLWGLGLVRTTLGTRENYLHDGRARTIEEAILWHGGEASGSKNRFKQLPKSERELILNFLGSL